MATRFYLPSSGASPLGALAVGAWTGSVVNFFRAPAVTAKSNTALTNFADRFLSTATRYDCWGQWVSEEIPANFSFTAGHTASIFVRGLEGDISVDAQLALGIRVVSSDGATVRGTPKAIAAFGTEYPNNATSRGALGAALTAVDTLATDRIVIEVGCYGLTPSIGYDATLRFGDPVAVADLIGSGYGTDLCPWVELSCDPFAGGGGGGTCPLGLLRTQFFPPRGVIAHG